MRKIFFLAVLAILMALYIMDAAVVRECRGNKACIEASL